LLSHCTQRGWAQNIFSLEKPILNFKLA
jgi:hypothetical protein